MDLFSGESFDPGLNLVDIDATAQVRMLAILETDCGLIALKPEAFAGQPLFFLLDRIFETEMLEGDIAALAVVCPCSLTGSRSRMMMRASGSVRRTRIQTRG